MGKPNGTFAIKRSLFTVIRPIFCTVLKPSRFACPFGTTISVTILWSPVLGYFTVVVVQEIGDLGVATLQDNDEVKPKRLLCRKLPLSLQDDMKREIDKLVEKCYYSLVAGTRILHGKICFVQRFHRWLVPHSKCNRWRSNLIFANKFLADCVNISQEIGDLGVGTLQVNDEVKPKTLPCRKLPLSLQDDVKCEIDKLVERNVLVPVYRPNGVIIVVNRFEFSFSLTGIVRLSDI
jgi:hypothetical protein